MFSAGCATLSSDEPTSTREYDLPWVHEVRTTGWVDPLTDRIDVVAVVVAMAAGVQPVDLADAVAVTTVETDVGTYSHTYRYGGTVGTPTDPESFAQPVVTPNESFRISVYESAGDDDSTVLDDKADRYGIVFSLGGGRAPALSGEEKVIVKIHPDGGNTTTIRFSPPESLDGPDRLLL